MSPTNNDPPIPEKIRTPLCEPQLVTSSPADDTWVAAEQAKGALPAPGEQAQQGILARVRRGTNISRNEQSIDDALSEDHYRMCYGLFAHTARHGEIAKTMGIPPKHVLHLLNKGIRRLSLPSIREHATSYAEVNQRLGGLANEKNQATSSEFMSKMPDVQQAITERATREAATAATLLEATMLAAVNSLNYVNKFMEQVSECGYTLPEEVTMDAVIGLNKVVKEAGNAVDKAVRLSRLTAGEPEANLSLNVSVLVASMSDQERQYFLETKTLPQRLQQGSTTQRVTDNTSDITNDLPPIDAEFTE